MEIIVTLHLRCVTKLEVMSSFVTLSGCDRERAFLTPDFVEIINNFVSLLDMCTSWRFWLGPGGLSFSRASVRHMWFCDLKHCMFLSLSESGRYFIVSECSVSRSILSWRKATAEYIPINTINGLCGRSFTFSWSNLPHRAVSYTHLTLPTILLV